MVDGLKGLLGTGVQVSYVQGAGFDDAFDPRAVERAVDLAKRSDVAVLCLGTSLRVEAEGRDRRNLNLPGAQQQLMEAVYAANPKTILVLMNAGPLAVTWAQDHLPAILEAWYPGEAGGIAIARAIFGLDDPGGHLPYTIYAGLYGVPPPNDYNVNDGFTYQYFRGIPLYAFGFGLSYTRFQYSGLEVKAVAPGPDGETEVSFNLRNVGDRAGADVAQLYTHQETSRTYQPIQSLRAFERVELQPGQTRRIVFRLPTKDLAYYDSARHAFVVEPVVFDVRVGDSSDNIRLRGKLTVAPAAAKTGAKP